MLMLCLFLVRGKIASSFPATSAIVRGAPCGRFAARASMRGRLRAEIVERRTDICGVWDRGDSDSAACDRLRSGPKRCHFALIGCSISNHAPDSPQCHQKGRPCQDPLEKSERSRSRDGVSPVVISGDPA